MPKAVAKKPDLKIVAFKSPDAFNAWLKKNHAKSDGIWLKMFKKATGKASISYKEAVDEALCFGWIDGQAKPIDAASWMQRYTPRRPKSIWSQRNREHVARLIKEGRMQPAGQEAIAAAKADGRWDRAYQSPKNLTVPEDLLAALEKNKKAKKFFATINKANVYAITWRLETAKKPETRAKRLKEFVAMLARGETIH